MPKAVKSIVVMQMIVGGQAHKSSCLGEWCQVLGQGGFLQFQVSPCSHARGTNMW